MREVNLEVNFIDFDQTATRENTFFGFKITTCNYNKHAQYLSGKEQAKINVKKGIEEILKPDVKTVCAIVTHHNNSFFIAGFVSQILGQELTYKETRFLETSDFAIDVFTIADIKHPFLISYCAKIDQEHTDVMLKEPDKNIQILALRKLFCDEGFIYENTDINFYDDSEANINAARALPHMTCHHIAAKSDRFITQDKYLGEFLSSPGKRRVLDGVQLAKSSDPFEDSDSFNELNKFSALTFLFYPPATPHLDNTDRDDSLSYSR